MSLFSYLVLLRHKLPILGFGAAFCDNDGQGAGCNTGLPQVNATSNQLQDILQIAFAILGALSALFIVMAGLRFITAQGDPQEVGKAKATIAYALIGLLVALIAEAIVAFTLGKLK